MPPQEQEIHGLRSDVAGLRATVTGQAEHISRIDAWLQRISDDLRKKPTTNSMPVYIALLTGVSVLVSLGTFALRPVQENVERVEKEIRLIRSHDSDGHPEMVMNRLDAINAVHTRERVANQLAIRRDEERMDAIDVRISILETVAEERTERFIRTLEQRDRISEMRSKDRLTGSEHKIHAQSIEQRLKKLETNQHGE